MSLKVYHNMYNLIFYAQTIWMDMSKALSMNPKTFPYALGVLYAANSTLIILDRDMRATVAYDDEEVGGKIEVARGGWNVSLKQLESKIVNSKRLSQSSTISKSALLLLAIQLKLAVTSLPDKKRLAKAMKATGDIIVGLVNSAASMSLDRRLIKGVISGVSLGECLPYSLFVSVDVSLHVYTCM